MLIDPLQNCLIEVFRLKGIRLDDYRKGGSSLCPDGYMDMTALSRICRIMGLKAGEVTSSPDNLHQLPVPFIAKTNDGFVTVERCIGDNIIIYDPKQGASRLITVENFLEIWQGENILFKSAEEKDGIGHFGISWFLPYITARKRQLLQVIVLSLLLQCFGLVTPYFTQLIIDDVLVHHSVGTLDVLMLGLLSVVAFQAVMGAFRTLIFTKTVNKIDAGLSSKLFERLVRLPGEFYARWKSGELVSRMREIEKVRQFITGTGLIMMVDAVFSLIYIGILLSYSVSLSLILMVAIVAYILLNAAVVPIYHRRLNESFEANAASQSHIIETVIGIESVKNLAAEYAFETKWRSILARLVKAELSVANLVNASSGVGMLINQLFTLAVLWYGAILVMDDKLSLGQLIAFQMIAGMVIGPVLRIFSTWQSFQQTKVSLDKIGDIMNACDEEHRIQGKAILPRVKGQIDLEQILFRYSPQDNPVLSHLNMHIPAESCVGIVGASGSGKTTVAKLLQQLYFPEAGRVLVDGMDTSHMDSRWMRQYMGIVLQESFLFNGTIAENIALGKSGASLSDIERAAELSGANEFIKKLPHGLDTMVGERGCSLSGGQRQRVAIARAIISDPAILILDEATSALDYESETSLMRNLAGFSKGRTVIMIAHRLSTLTGCDRIFVMNKGTVAEEGTHGQLLERRGLYHSLWMHQQNAVSS